MSITRPEPASTGAPQGPTDLPAPSWRGVLRRTAREFREDDATDWAAALTYYGILSIFPALLVLMALVGLAGSGATNALIDNLEAVTPGPARDIVTSAVQNLQDSRGATTGALIAGLAAALWSASGYIGAFSRAANAIWEVEEGRPFHKLRPQQLALTALMLILLSVSAVAVVVTGGVADQVGQLVGAGDTAVTVWDIAKWPLLLVIVSVMLALLYWASPNAQQPGIRWISPGGVLAVCLWLLASAGFALYVANFGSYNKTYGSLAGAIVFLVWLWITNLAVLLGAEFNAEITRARQIARGQPEDHEPITPPRDTTKLDTDDGGGEGRAESGAGDADGPGRTAPRALAPVAAARAPAAPRPAARPAPARATAPDPVLAPRTAGALLAGFLVGLLVARR